MSDATSSNPNESERTLLSDGADDSSSGANGTRREDSEVDVTETIVQSEATRDDSTILGSQHIGPAQSADEAATCVDATVVSPEASRTMPDRLSGEAAADTGDVDATMQMDSRLASENDSSETAATIVGPASVGTDPPFTVEATLIGSDNHPSATVPEGGGGRKPPDTLDQTLVSDGSAGDSSAEKEPVATKIGRFEIVKVLGQGAFGTVYLAHDPHLDRKVAVKVAKTGVLSGKQDVDRFMREARSAAQLRHQHIVPVYEFERLPHSSFIAYEFVEGRTLGDFLKERKTLTCEEAADYIAKLASALDYAHSLGIIHRDMKPENILLDKDGEPHIADFGLARRDDGDTLRTREGMFMGTPSYMSPEQAGGNAHLADGRADIWSLGVMLHEMLTGVRPFRGSVTEVLVAVQNTEPPPLRQIDKTIPRDLETICQKAMTKNLEGRYQRAQDLADELQRWRDGIPILARPISLPHRAWRWAKRHPDIAGLLGAVMAAILIGGIISTWFGISATRSAQQMRQARAERAATQLAALSTAVPASVPEIIGELKFYQEDIAPRLAEAIKSPDISGSARARLAMAQAVLERDSDSDSSQELFDEVSSQMLESNADELIMLTGLIREYGYRKAFEKGLWRTGQRQGGAGPRRFRALAALAALDSDVPDWPRVNSDVVAEMLTMNLGSLFSWLPAFRPVREELEEPLTEQFMSGSDPNVRVLAATVLAELFHDSLEILVTLIPQAKPEQLAPLLVALRDRKEEVVPRLSAQLQQHLAEDIPQGGGDGKHYAEVANLAVALLALQEEEAVWPLLRPSPDQEVRSRLVHAIPPAGVPWRTISRRLEWETDPVAQAALCLTLGEYGLGDLLPGDRDQLATTLLNLFATHPHAGVHAAAEWTLRRLGKEAEVDLAKAALPTAERVPERQWHLDPQGNTFVIFDGPIEYEMGSAASTPHHEPNEERHRELIPRTFGIASHEVTVAEYLRSREKHPDPTYADYAPEPDCPVVMLNWIDAAMYCRWLSEQAGIDEREMCYPPLDVLENARKQFGVTLTLPEDLLDRTGYRLPTAAEWEHACRTGTDTAWSFGNDEELLGRYCWYDENTSDRTMPVGVLKPNDWGLFDMHGNALEWCHSFFFDEYVDPAARSDLVVDGVDSRNEKGSYRELRGGSYFRPASDARTAYRWYDLPRSIYFDQGFRIARTYRER